jgi:hypothetical protein
MVAGEIEGGGIVTEKVFSMTLDRRPAVLCSCKGNKKCGDRSGECQMDRRRFMMAALSLGVVVKAKATELRVDQPLIHFVDDEPGEWFVIQYGWICAHAERLAGGGPWKVEVWPFVGRHDKQGGYCERRLVPSSALKEKLIQGGFVCEFSGEPMHLLPALVGQTNLGPFQLYRVVAKAVHGCAQGRLWYDPSPEEWRNFVLPAEPQAQQEGIWLPVSWSVHDLLA